MQEFQNLLKLVGLEFYHFDVANGDYYLTWHLNILVCNLPFDTFSTLRYNLGSYALEMTRGGA